LVSPKSRREHTFTTSSSTKALIKLLFLNEQELKKLGHPEHYRLLRSDYVSFHFSRGGVSMVETMVRRILEKQDSRKESTEMGMMKRPTNLEW